MSARSVIYRFIALPPSSGWRAAHADEVTAFGRTEEGAELIREWGSKAAANVGIVRGRISMMVKAAKSAADRQAGLVWFDSLSSSQFKAVVRALLP